MKSKVVLMVVFYTYLSSNRVASIPFSQDTARYQGGLNPTSRLNPSFNNVQQADLYSQNFVAQNAMNQFQYQILQNLNPQQTYGYNQVNTFQNQLPQSFLRQNQRQNQELNSYRGINQGSIGNSANLQQLQRSNVLPQNPSQIFAASKGINNQAFFQQPLFGVYQKQKTVPRNNLNYQQFLINFSGNGSPVPTGNEQQQNQYAVVYPERRFEYNPDIKTINRQYQNLNTVNNRQELTPVSRVQPTLFPVPNITTQKTPIVQTTQSVFPAPGPTLAYSIPTSTPTPKPAFAPTNLVSSTSTLTSVPASSTPIFVPTTQAFKPLTSFDINNVIALTKRFSENAAKKARVKAIAPAISTSTNTASATSASSVTSTSAASQTSSSVPAYIAPSTSTAAIIPSKSSTSQTSAAPVIKSGRKGAMSWFSTADPNWLTTLLGGDNKGHVFFVMAPNSNASL